MTNSLALNTWVYDQKRELETEQHTIEYAEGKMETTFQLTSKGYSSNYYWTNLRSFLNNYFLRYRTYDPPPIKRYKTPT